MSSSVDHLFPTPLVVDRLEDPGLNAALEAAILERRRADPGLSRSNLGGWHSDDAFLEWGGEPARRLAARIFHLAHAETLLRTREQVTLQWTAQGWANVNEPGASNAAHAHPGCFWSAVYYVRIDEGTGGELILHDPRSPAMEMYSPLLWFSNGGIQREGSIRPQPGMLVMFPSWLLHSVKPWYGEGLRISIAINLRAELIPAAGS